MTKLEQRKRIKIIVAGLDGLDFSGDGKQIHGEADELLLQAIELLDFDVYEAYMRARERADFWAYA